MYDDDPIGKFVEEQGRAAGLTQEEFAMRSEPFTSRTIFPLFDGLIPEGWLLRIAQKTWNIDARDRMGLLLAVCKDPIGAVHVEPIDHDERSAGTVCVVGNSCLTRKRIADGTAGV